MAAAGNAQCASPGHDRARASAAGASGKRAAPLGPGRTETRHHMRAAVPRQLAPAEGAPPWVGASPVAALFAAQRPWREAATLMRDPVWHGVGVPDGRQLPVMLVPGFLAGDPSLSIL